MGAPEVEKAGLVAEGQWVKGLEAVNFRNSMAIHKGAVERENRGGGEWKTRLSKTSFMRCRKVTKLQWSLALKLVHELTKLFWPLTDGNFVKNCFSITVTSSILLQF